MYALERNSGACWVNYLALFDLLLTTFLVRLCLHLTAHMISVLRDLVNHGARDQRPRTRGPGIEEPGYQESVY